MTDYVDTGFRMIGDIYYVGPERVSSHLLASSDGHILIDTAYPGDDEGILERITQLGFDPGDVRYILITHAHPDHIGSAKALAEATGAKVCIGRRDVERACAGARRSGGGASREPVKVDIVLEEGDVITAGDKEVRVYHTPGHTPGCCSFGFDVRHDGQDYAGFLFGGPGLNVFDPVKLARGIYGGTKQDFAATLERLATLDVSVWLGAHPNQNDTFGKHARDAGGETPNPYIDAQGFTDFLAGLSAGLDKLM